MYSPSSSGIRASTSICLVDSVENAQQLFEKAETARLDRPLQLLVEGGFTGGRTGCRDLAAALDLARRVRRCGPRLALRGVEGFEGLSRGASPQESEWQATEFLDFLLEIATACQAEDLFAAGSIILSAGGSKYYYIVAERFGRVKLGRELLVVTRSGCYLTHDSVLYRKAFDGLVKRSPQAEALGTGLLPALELWAYVQSRPEPSKALLTMGKRDVSYDDLPVALKWARPGQGETVGGGAGPHCHGAERSALPYGRAAGISTRDWRHGLLRDLASLPHLRQMAGDLRRR